MWFSTVVFKNVLRRPLRSALTVMAIAIAVGTVVAFVGIADGFERSFLDLYENSGFDLIVSRAGAKQRLTSSLDEKLGDQIRQIPGVRDVDPGMADIVSFEEYGLYGVLVQGWVPETRVFDHLTITAGRALRKGDGRVVLLGTLLAANLGKHVGDRLKVQEDDEYEVVGVYRSGNVFENGALIMPLEQLQRMMERPHQVTGYSVVLSNPQDQGQMDRVRHEIEALGKGITALPAKEHVKSITEVQLAKAMGWLTSTVAFVVGAFGMMNTMVMSVHERTREIGILRAIGWKRGRVVRMILLEAVALSLGGAALGSLGAVVLLKVLTRLPAVSGLITGRTEPLLFAEGALIAVIVGLVCGALPAARAARMLPTAALRYE